MTALTRIPHPNPDFVVRNVGEETVFLAPAGDQIHSLNATGSVIWGHVDGRNSLQDILAALVAEFEVTEAQARTDLLAFVEELASKDILRWEPAQKNA